MPTEYNPDLKIYSNKLRKEMTDAERRIWKHIRGKQIKNLQFYRQKIIGSYIVDFYCPEANIVIEIDGGQHFEAKGLCEDKMRDKYLSSLGFKVLRFNNLEVLQNTEGVYQKLLEEL